MIKQECIGNPDMILLLWKIEAEVVVCPGGAYFLAQFFFQQFIGT